RLESIPLVSRPSTVIPAGILISRTATLSSVLVVVIEWFTVSQIATARRSEMSFLCQFCRKILFKRVIYPLIQARKGDFLRGSLVSDAVKMLWATPLN